MIRTAARSPRGVRQGWGLVVVLACTEMVSWGVLYYAFAVFLKPMQADLGWSRSALTGAFSLALLLSGVAGLGVGSWLDRHGPHAVMTIGSCAAVVLVLAWSQVHTLLLFYAIWTAIGVVMALIFYEPAFWVVAHWFDRQRGRAMTVLTFIAGFASVIFIPVAGWLVSTEGWRTALIIFAVMLGITTILPHAVILRGAANPPPRQFERAPRMAAVRGGTAVLPLPLAPAVTRADALRSAAFWAVALAFFLITLGTAALTVHLVPLLTDRGYPAPFAAAMGGMVGVMSLPGRLIFTPLGDHVRRSWVAAGIFVLHAIGLVALILVPSEVGVIAFVVLFGTGFGAITPPRASLIAELYGHAHFGEVNSVVALGVTLARAAGPLGMSLVYDHFGGYTIALLILIGAALLAAAALLFGDARMRASTRHEHTPPDRG